MISVNKISLGFGGRDLFKDISFQITGTDRIGLVGKNGAGKSTLLKIFSGEQKADSGNISGPNDLTIGFLKQDLEFSSGKTVMEETESAFEEIKELEARIEEINEAITTRTDYESDSYMDLITELNEATERFSMIGGYNFKADLERVLIGLGFKQEDFDRQTTEFSGGWRMRIELAKLLLQKNELMLLDEPTNHLDIESIIWLEEFLQTYEGAVLLVSHDRSFLDSVTNRTIEISYGNIYDYKASYSKYIVLRQERREKQIQAKKNQDQEIKQTQMLINKFRAKASKAAFAQSLIKKLDKMVIIEVDEEDTKSMRFKFPPAPHSGKVVLTAKNVGKRYGDHQVFSNVDMMIERQEKIAFVGQNGQGKSTLAKIIIGELEHTGKVELGHNVKVGYYAQDQANSLDGNKTILQTIEDAADDNTRPRVRDLLGSFMFSGDDVQKKVKVLSGGEKGRVALCKLLLEPSNVLVLDEPTNHLDMMSKDVLKNSLKKYDGTLILVSHDRDFLQGLSNKVFEFRDGEVKEHLGDINSYLESRKVADFRQLELETNKKVAAKKEESKKKEESGLTYDEKKQLEKDIRKETNALSKVEKEVEDLETTLAELDEKLHKPEEFKKLSEDTEFFAKYEEMKSRLDTLMADWEKQQATVEKLLAKRE